MTWPNRQKPAKVRHAAARNRTRGLEAWVNEGSARLGPDDCGPDLRALWVQSAETFREYAWENGKRIDGDLTSLFIERQP
jgi:hypothetical protein